MYSADFCSFPFGQNEKKVERWKSWKRQRLILVLARENVFKWWRDKMPVSFLCRVDFIERQKNLGTWRSWEVESRTKRGGRRESIWVELFSGTHTKQHKSQKKWVFKKENVTVQRSGRFFSARFHRRRPPREDEEEEVAVFLSLFFYFYMLLLLLLYSSPLADFVQLVRTRSLVVCNQTIYLFIFFCVRVFHKVYKNQALGSCVCVYKRLTSCCWSS